MTVHAVLAGSGKTHTMSGHEDIISDDSYNGHDNDGIISRAMQYLFHQVCLIYSVLAAAITALQCSCCSAKHVMLSTAALDHPQRTCCHALAGRTVSGPADKPQATACSWKHA
jgi:hypothetical protein